MANGSGFRSQEKDSGGVIQAIALRGFPHLFISAFDMSGTKAGECRSLSSSLCDENRLFNVAARHELGFQWKEHINEKSRKDTVSCL